MTVIDFLTDLVGQTGPRLLIAGGSGLVGKALQRVVAGGPCQVFAPAKAELNCTRQADVEQYFAVHKPDCLIIAAGRVGGIWANQQFPADFAYDNLLINANLLHAARLSGVKRVLVLGSSCIYPKFAPQPMLESSLLTGALEPTNEAYAIAKIAALKLAHSYVLQYGMDIRALMPTNLYGPGDRYDALQSHVIPALLLRMQQTLVDGQEEFVVWGSGTVQREFLYVDDLANAIVQVLSVPKEIYQSDWHDSSKPLLTEFFYNVGGDDEVTIRDLVHQIGLVTGFRGQIRFDPTRPDGTPRKKLDCKRLFAMCPWRPQTGLFEGLSKTWQDDFVDTHGEH